MLKFLRIFSWLLFTFGVVGFLAVALGFKPDIGSVASALGILGIQVMFSAMILYGFRLHRQGRIGRHNLVYGSWVVIVALVIIGQVWINISDVNF
ncbi:MAG: hypothetical protein ABJM39_12715 [Porticoccus sp.]|jgi:hypothetical protein|uniref:hypothetical protein n=1 Tax=Porticoccus sp. TaxID=2024853 RepID=UPI0032973E0F